MDLNAVNLFVVAAQVGSLSEAARRTGVPLPTLSRKVRKLEDELGVRLLERSIQGLMLTEAGARFFAEAAPAFSLLVEAEQRLHDASGVSGRLRVSIPPHFEPMWSVFDEFGRRHPGVRFDVFVTDRRVDLVSDGIDVVIRVGEGGRSHYVGRTLGHYRHRLVAAPAYVAQVALEKPKDLSQLDCAGWRTGGASSWRLGDLTFSFEPLVATNDYQHLLHLAVSGRAVTEVPPFLARAGLDADQLVHVLPDYPLPKQTVRALVVDTRLLSPLVRHFLDFAAEAVSELLAPYADG